MTHLSILTFNIDKDAPIEQIDLLCDKLLVMHLDVVCLQEVTEPFYEVLTKRMASNYLVLPHHEDASSGNLFHSLQGNDVPHLNCIFLLRSRVCHDEDDEETADKDEEDDHNNNNNDHVTSPTVELMTIPRKILKFGGSRITAANFVLFDDDDEDDDIEDCFYSNTISLVNIHLLADTSKRYEKGEHQQAREEQVESLGQYLDLTRQQERHAIVVGDFNYDRESESNESRMMLRETFGMIDAVRFQHPGNEPVTWHSKFEEGVIARLDRILVHNLNVIDTKTFKLTESDHLAVMAKLELPSPISLRS